jgi:hypothetical protein
MISSTPFFEKKFKLKIICVLFWVPVHPVFEEKLSQILRFFRLFLWLKIMDFTELNSGFNLGQLIVANDD